MLLNRTRKLDLNLMALFDSFSLYSPSILEIQLKYVYAGSLFDVLFIDVCLKTRFHLFRIKQFQRLHAYALCAETCPTNFQQILPRHSSLATVYSAFPYIRRTYFKHGPKTRF